MTAAPDTAPASGPGAPHPPEDVLAVRNLNVAVGERKLAEDVDFTIRAA